MSPGAAEASARHPFLRGLPEAQRPSGWKDPVADVRSWLATRPHLPPISDDFVLLFLHSCYMDVARAQATIESYFTCKSRWPELFGNRDPLAPELQKILDCANLVALPEATPEGNRVLLYRMVETDPSKLHFVTALRLFFIFNDMRLSEDGLAPGYVVVFDMAGVSWGHLARVSLPAIRKFMIYIQDCHPARLKGVHVINTVAFIDRILGLIKPLIKSDLLTTLHFHGPVESLERYLPLRVLPEDYGGEAEPAQTLHDAMRKKLEQVYREWFIAEEALRVDFSKRPPKRNSGGRAGAPLRRVGGRVGAVQGGATAKSRSRGRRPLLLFLPPPRQQQQLMVRCGGLASESRATGCVTRRGRSTRPEQSPSVTWAVACLND